MKKSINSVIGVVSVVVMVGCGTYTYVPAQPVVVVPAPAVVVESPAAEILWFEPGFYWVGGVRIWREGGYYDHRGHRHEGHRPEGHRDEHHQIRDKNHNQDR